MDRKLIDQLNHVVKYLRMYNGMENVNDIILLNKITQFMIDTSGHESPDTIADSTPLSSIAESIEELFNVVNIEDVVDAYISDDLNLEEYFTKEQLNLVTPV